jgi:CRP/FNR family cyclic AMP-dependent transcriptional regulator
VPVRCAKETVAARFTSAVSLSEVDPELIDHLDPEQAAAARSRAVARVAILDDGEPCPWGWIDGANAHLGLLILEGLLTRNVTLLGRTTMELLGAGDLVRPWDDSAEHPSVPEAVTWTVHLRTRVAVLDQRFVERIAPWPGIATALVSRGARRAQWLAHHLAILENPRVDARLLLLFWQLADRWGTVGADGVAVPFQFTHKTLGRLVRAQRPSVTASLHELSERGLLTRREGDGAWILHGDPALQLRLLHDGRERV